MSLTRINKAGEPHVVAASDGRLTISILVQIMRRSGRKLVTDPKGGTAARPWDAEPTLLHLALTRRHRWLAMFEPGVVKLLRESPGGGG